MIPAPTTKTSHSCLTAPSLIGPPLTACYPFPNARAPLAALQHFPAALQHRPRGREIPRRRGALDRAIEEPGQVGASFSLAGAGGEGAERDRRDRRAGGEGRHLRRGAGGGVGEEERAGDHALLALAGAGAEAGVPLRLLDVVVAERRAVGEVVERDVLAAADDRLGAHGFIACSRRALFRRWRR